MVKNKQILKAPKTAGPKSGKRKGKGAGQSTEASEPANQDADAKDGPGPVYFWKEAEEDGFLCQWYEFPMRDNDGVRYRTCEHYMMYQKAIKFVDQKTADKILTTKSPRSVKSLGRKVADFDADIWDECKYRIVCDGNYLKFTVPAAVDEECSSDGPVSDLKLMLLKTGDRDLVEASPFDRLWGIGFAKDKASYNRQDWGQNLLGKALMEVRYRIRREDATPKDAEVPEEVPAEQALEKPTEATQDGHDPSLEMF